MEPQLRFGAREGEIVRRWGSAYYQLCGTRAGQTVARVALAGLRHLGVFRRFSMPLDALTLDHTAAAGLMRLWRRVHWSSGDGMMPPEQLLAIYRLAVGWPGRGDVVELGAWVGLTTCYLATACRVRGEGRVHAVDTFEGTKEGGGQYPSLARFGGNTLSAFRERIRQARVSDLVETLVGYTSETVQHYRGRPIRFLLIDADHSYEAVWSDFELWSPLVAPGGLIVFHDYLMEGVARFVEGELRADDRFEMSPGQVASNVMAMTKRADGEAPVGGAPGPGRSPRSCRVGREERRRENAPGIEA